MHTSSLSQVTVLLAMAAVNAAAQTPPVQSARTPTGVVRATGVPQYEGLRWRFQTGGPVRSSPSLVDGVVYVGSGDGHLYALDAMEGALRWRSDAGSSVTSAPLVTNDAVFITTRDNAVHRVRRLDGALAWRMQTGPDMALAWGHEGTDIYTSSPVLARGVLLVGSGDGSLYALDPATGAQRWRFRTGGRVRGTVAILDSTVFIGSFDGRVYAVDLRTGAERWQHDTEGTSLNSQDFGYDRRSIQSSPVVSGGALYVGSRDGHLYTLDPATGHRRWRVAHDETSWIIATPAVRDSVVFVGSSDAHFVQALSARDGREIWRARTIHSVWASPVVADGVVYVAEGGYDGYGFGYVRALNAADGTERWRVATGGPAMSSPAVGNGLLVVGSDDGAVYALGAGARTLARAVFWDSLAVPLTMVASHQRIRDQLRYRGYELLDAAGLKRWMETQISSGGPSVVVFAIDHAPRLVAGASADTVLLRRYLNAGGKIVWPGLPPRMWLPDSTGHRTMPGFGGTGTSVLLGLPVHVDPWDRFGARVTTAGQRWGLSGWWLSQWASPTVDGAEVLAFDERGHVAAWVRNYGGAPGTGFVQLGRPDWDEVSLRQLAAIAEFRPGVRR